MSDVKCWDCKNKMRVPGSAHIACAWRRGNRSHVWFFEGFNPNYPVPVFECEGWEQGEVGVFLEEAAEQKMHPTDGGYSHADNESKPDTISG